MPLTEPRRLTVGGLFSGIGGWELGLERAGFEIAWHCERDEFCRKVLALRWPEVPCYDDVRALVADAPQPGLETLDGYGVRDFSTTGEGSVARPDSEGIVPVRVPYVDVLCGGFPCQDISVAGKGAGIRGSRSGLWSEFARLTSEIRPRYVLVENVAALLGRGLDVVLGDLAEIGYDAEWGVISAADVGAPHLRKRVWIVAYPARDVQGGAEGKRVRSGGTGGGAVSDPEGDGRRQGRQGRSARAGADGEGFAAEKLADAHGAGSQGHGRPVQRAGERTASTGGAARRAGEVADPDNLRRQRSGQARDGRGGSTDGGVGIPANASRGGRQSGEFDLSAWESDVARNGWWCTEPDVGRVANGVPHRVDRLRALGNALVPQIAEWIGRRILEYENGR